MTESSGQTHSAQLTQSLADLVAESQALRADVSTSERARQRENTISIAILLLLTVFIALVLTVTWQNNLLARQVKDTNDRVADCTTAGGTCYEQGRQSTGTAIASIIQAEIYVAECARLHPGESGPVFDAAIEKCVGDKLVAHATPPTPR